jgi:methyltransferase (TIGR00027 family)
VSAEQRLFVDPLAPKFLTWPLSLVALLNALPGGGRLARGIIDRRWPGVRTSVAARTRLIDDILGGLDRGQLGQLVILGAGFDSRAYRLDALCQVPVFEVDHPDTQRAKQQGLARALPSWPDHVAFVASDFNLENLGPAMATCGYRIDVPTVFLWEGVTNYLSAEAVDATLRWCAQAAPGSLLIFTYINRDILTNAERYVGSAQWKATLDKVGEQTTFGLDPTELPGYLAERGLQLEGDQGAAEYRARYFGPRAEQMVGHEFYRLAVARVTGD